MDPLTPTTTATSRRSAASKANAAAAASSAGVGACLAPQRDRRQAFEEEFKEQRVYQSHRLKPLGRSTQRRLPGGASLEVDPGYAFGVVTSPGQGGAGAAASSSVKALLSPSKAQGAAGIDGGGGDDGGDDDSPRPRRHSQGLHLPPTYVFGRGMHGGQYKGGASDGVAGALAYVDGGATLPQPHKAAAAAAYYDQSQVFGLRSRRDEEGTLKACLSLDAAGGGQDDDGAGRRRQQQQEQEDRRLALAVFGSRGRSKEATAAQLLAPDAVGLGGGSGRDDDEYLAPRSKEDLRRIFLQRLGPQCGLTSEEAFDRVFARAAVGKRGGDGAQQQQQHSRCSIQAFRAVLEAEQRGAGSGSVGGR